MTPTPQWLVERLAANDLPAAEAAQVRARLEAEGGLGRLTELEAANRAMLEQHSVAVNVAAIRRRSAPAAQRRPWVMPVFAMGLAVAAAVVVLMRPSTPLTSIEESPETTRLKGLEPRLLVHRQNGTKVELLTTRSSAKAGDRLQLGYVSASRKFGAIVSIDGRGNVTQHWPERGTDAAALEGSGEVPLPHAYVLDDAPEFERFVLFTSNEPFSLTSILAERTLASAPASVEMTVVQIQKVSP